jgi:hypothetical protein
MRLTGRQGRDNIVKLHEPLVVSGTAGDAGAAAGGAGDRYPPPGVRASMPANALNFCAFSLAHDSSDGDTESWLALPNLADSELVRPSSPSTADASSTCTPSHH